MHGLPNPVDVVVLGVTEAIHRTRVNMLMCLPQRHDESTTQLKQSSVTIHKFKMLHLTFFSEKTSIKSNGSVIASQVKKIEQS